MCIKYVRLVPVLPVWKGWTGVPGPGGGGYHGGGRWPGDWPMILPSLSNFILILISARLMSIYISNLIRRFGGS